MIKTSPLLDFAAGLSELKSVKAIHVVAVKNEVKELLWILEKDYAGSTMVHAVNIVKDGEEIFSSEYGNQPLADYGFPQKYLYEPNASIMKAGLFDAVGNAFGLTKLHKHSHLYTSGHVIEFPGRIFEIVKSVRYNKAGIAELSQVAKANITVRNFPGSVENLRKKLKIKDGGDVYCFFTTDANDDKIVSICAKI